MKELNLSILMLGNPERDQPTPSLVEASKLVIGAVARTRLLHAIIEAEDAKTPIKDKESKKEHLASLNHRLYFEKAYRNFLKVLEKEKGRRVKIQFQLREKYGYWRKTGAKKQLTEEKIINPLAEIYAQLEGREPETESPWPGELLIKAVKEPEKTKAVYLLLAEFGLDPQRMVAIVHGVLAKNQQEIVDKTE